jgi:restriction system protein
MALFEIALDDWWDRAQAYVKQQRDENAQIDRFRLRYAQARPDAVTEFFDAVLSHAEYPDMFPMRWEMGFEAETGALVIDCELPSPEDFPTLKGAKYDVLQDIFEQSYWSASEIAQLYEIAVYQTCLRSLHDVFAADEADVIASVTFNGWANFTDRVHGRPARACIISVQATKAQLGQTNLLAVDPKTCFKSLKGVASAQLADMTAVIPLMILKRPDDRRIPANDVAEGNAAARPSNQSGDRP